MRLDNIAMKTASAEIEKLHCKHCGERWGRHYGPFCYHWHSDSEFTPEGMCISTLCTCGYPLEEHIKRKYCPKAGLTFGNNTFNTFIQTLPEELFEI